MQMWSSWFAWCISKLCRWPFTLDFVSDAACLIMHCRHSVFGTHFPPETCFALRNAACWALPVRQWRALDGFMLKSCWDLTWQGSLSEFDYLGWSTHAAATTLRFPPNGLLQRVLACVGFLSVCCLCLCVCLWTLRHPCNVHRWLNKKHSAGGVNAETLLCFAQYSVIWSRAAKCNWVNRPLKCAVIGCVWRLFWQRRLWRVVCEEESVIALNLSQCVKRERLDGLLSALCVFVFVCVSHKPAAPCAALLQFPHFEIKFQANISSTFPLWAPHCHSSLKHNWKGIFNSSLCTRTTLPHYTC